MSNTFSSLEASSHKEQEGKGGTPQISPLPSSRTSQNKSQENGENRRNGEKFQDKLQDFRLAVAAALSAAAITLAPSPTAAESLPGSLVSTGVNGGTGVHSSGGSLTETLPA
jgi:hypothetical protein